MDYIEHKYPSSVMRNSEEDVTVISDGWKFVSSTKEETGRKKGFFIQRRIIEGGGRDYGIYESAYACGRNGREEPFFACHASEEYEREGDSQRTMYTTYRFYAGS